MARSVNQSIAWLSAVVLGAGVYGVGFGLFKAFAPSEGIAGEQSTHQGHESGAEAEHGSKHAEHGEAKKAETGSKHAAEHDLAPAHEEPAAEAKHGSKHASAEDAPETGKTEHHDVETRKTGSDEEEHEISADQFKNGEHH